MLYALACAGILITTGGCAESATAPEAANIEASANRSKKAPTTEPSTTEPTDSEVSTMGGMILVGGGRASEP
jgi:hypothetical protein